MLLLLLLLLFDFRNSSVGIVTKLRDGQLKKPWLGCKQRQNIQN